MGVNEKMTAIADAIRAKTGGTDALTLDGMAEAIPEVYDKGKQAEHDAFWEVFQNGGKTQNYYYAFAVERFNDATYNPKYDIKCSNGTTPSRYIFYNQSGITDTKVGIYANNNNADFCFNQASALRTIRLFYVYETTGFNQTFNGCSALKNLTIGGTIGKAIDLSNSTKLTHESLMSVIEHLGTVTSAVTCTLGTENLAKLTDTEKAIATQKGWTLA